MIAVTKAGLIIEYEIKISRSDFRADFKKIRHRVFDAQMINEPHRGPAYFCYVVPAGLVKVDEIPMHAGLVYLAPGYQQIKPPPRLHGNKITDNQRQWLERSLIHRYWRERLRTERLGDHD